jgi:hypothetical protein
MSPRNCLRALFCALLFSGIAIHTAAQSDDRIREIRSIYVDLNERLTEMDSLVVTYHTAGAYPEMTIYTDYEGGVLIKTSNGSEMQSYGTEYYIKDQELAFVYHCTYEMLDHWSAPDPRSKRTEIRLYFDDNKVIRALKKSFEGSEQDFTLQDMSQIRNTAIDHLSDEDLDWTTIEARLKAVVLISEVLPGLF